MMFRMLNGRKLATIKAKSKKQEIFSMK